MHEGNQGTPGQETRPPAPYAPPPPGPPDAGAPGWAAPEPGQDPQAGEWPAALPPGPSILRGLRIWLLLIGAIGLAGVLLGLADLALAMTLAGAFVAAHAADRDARYRPLHLILTGVLVAGATVAFAVIGVVLVTQSAAGHARTVAVGIAFGSAVLCVLTAWRPLSDGMAAAIFRTTEPTHTLRLSARLVLMVLLFAVPGWAVFPGLLDAFARTGQSLLDSSQLLSSLIGLSMIALAGVGFQVRRTARETIERLGLRVPRPAHYGVVALGIAALFLLNVGIEGAQRLWFPDLWEQDQRINRLLAGGLGLGGGLLLGISAGVGEELAIRGALQPRLGLVFTSLVFAVLHVHYSWIGMATIFLLGLVLGLIRQRTSTTVAILVHTLYDILAVLTMGGLPGPAGGE